MERVLADLVETQEIIRFDPKGSLIMCQNLSDEILRKVKAKDFHRYCIIVTVTVGEKFHQSFCQHASFLWDSQRDSLANYVYDRSGIFIITTVYGIYYD